MKYKVLALRSRTLCRVYAVREHYNTVMTWGPWKRLSTAKRLRARLNKDRTLTVDRSGVVTDHGPLFRRVWIEELEESTPPETRRSRG